MALILDTVLTLVQCQVYWTSVVIVTIVHPVPSIWIIMTHSHTQKCFWQHWCIVKQCMVHKLFVFTCNRTACSCFLFMSLMYQATAVMVMMASSTTSYPGALLSKCLESSWEQTELLQCNIQKLSTTPTGVCLTEARWRQVQRIPNKWKHLECEKKIMDTKNNTEENNHQPLGWYSTSSQKWLKRGHLRIMGKSLHKSKHMFDQSLNWPL